MAGRRSSWYATKADDIHEGDEEEERDDNKCFVRDSASRIACEAPFDPIGIEQRRAEIA